MRGDDNAQSNLRYGEAATDLLRELVGNLSMSRDCFDLPGSWVTPKGMFAPFSFEIAAVLAQVSQQRATLHCKTTVSRMASWGTPRSASSRRSSRINSMAPARFLRHS